MIIPFMIPFCILVPIWFCSLRCSKSVTIRGCCCPIKRFLFCWSWRVGNCSCRKISKTMLNRAVIGNLAWDLHLSQEMGRFELCCSQKGSIPKAVLVFLSDCAMWQIHHRLSHEQCKRFTIENKLDNALFYYILSSFHHHG